MLPRSNCILCEELHGENPLSVRLGVYRSPAEKILVESAHFAVIPDIRPLVRFHWLVVTLDHVASLAEVPPANWDELVQVVSRSVREVRTAAGSDLATVMLFEHGGFDGQPGSGTCVNHAHLHVLPIPRAAGFPPCRDWLEEFGDAIAVEGLDDLPARVGETRSGYLFCDDGAGSAFLVRNLLQPVPCQYMRRVVAGHVGEAEWNWKSVLLERPSPATRQGSH